MAPPHKNTSRAAERRKQRRQRRAELGAAPTKQPTAAAPRMAPLTMDIRRKVPTSVAATAQMIDAEAEYKFVRRDLWRLVVYTAICFVLMMAVLFIVEG